MQIIFVGPVVFFFHAPVELHVFRTRQSLLQPTQRPGAGSHSADHCLPFTDLIATM